MIENCYSLTLAQDNPQGQLSGYKRLLGDEDYFKFMSYKLLDVAVLFDSTLNEPQIKTLFALIKSDFWTLDIAELKWMLEGIKIQSFNKFYAGNIYPYILEGIKKAHAQIWEGREMGAELKHNQTKEINIKPIGNEPTQIGE